MLVFVIASGWGDSSVPAPAPAPVPVSVLSVSVSVSGSVSVSESVSVSVSVLGSESAIEAIPGRESPRYWALLALE